MTRNGRRLRVLLVEDDEADYLITRGLLSGSGAHWFALDWESGYEDALTTIERNEHDVCLLDYHLAERDGLELLRAALARGAKTPMILLTGAGDYEVDVEAMKAGAMDFLVKGRIDAPLLERAIRYAVERSRLESQREKLIGELEDALVKIKTLSGLLPICVSCKRIRDDQGDWSELETFIHDHSEAQFSHGICPLCAEKLYPDQYQTMFLGGVAKRA